MNLDVNDLDLLEAVETMDGDQPQLTTYCCGGCFSSMQVVTNGCEW